MKKNKKETTAKIMKMAATTSSWKLTLSELQEAPATCGGFPHA